MLFPTSSILAGAALAGHWPLIAAFDPDASSQHPLVHHIDDEDEVDGVGKNPLTRDFRRKVVRWLGQWKVPGLAVGVVDGEDIWTQGYGIATYPSTPVAPSTLFYGASTSKAFTAATLSIMIASGNYTTLSGTAPGSPLGWTTPISALIPDDFVLMDDPWATAHITLEDALSHRTGLPRHDKANVHFLPAGPDGEKRVATPRDVTRILRYLPLNAAPRTTWQYCNQMFVVAGHVIQTLTGRWMGDLLREWIWEPLGMHSTYFSIEDALAAPEHFAAGYSWDKERGEFLSVPYMPTDEISGAGAVVSCVEDYTRWIRMMLREDAPVPKEGHRAVKTPRMIIDPQSVFGLAGYGGNSSTKAKALPYDGPLSYALGWIVGSYRGHTFWEHSGGMHAYGAEVFFFPSLDFGVVTFGNTATTSNWVGLFAVWQLVDDKLGVPEDERHDWEAEYRGFYDTMDAIMANAINKTYPDRPSTPIPPALPLHAYEGTYYHPAYQNFTLTTDATSKNALVANRSDATWHTVNEFEHVSGEYWMMFQRDGWGDRRYGPLSEYAPAQFRVGSDGEVEAMGVTWLQVNVGMEDVVEGLVWFDKIV
ncbi:hypothetical protein N0V93_002251 [Gnomoniopsis smithogilvyi]|uniref:Penicillin-binding protein n=1 Tax=Gnomoniopsis smithogilvyi TaxID=1191159 RepID=A0A9W8YUG0_9PEZI|nr:hypothetical protein N0V93_002251 [Gnomoniopsis smithogilvyi]